MQIDLFDQGLLLGISFLTFLLLTISFQKCSAIMNVPKIQRTREANRAKRRLRHRAFHSTLIFLISLTVGILLHWLVQLYFPQDPIPWQAVIWTIPFGYAFGLLGYNIRNLRPALAAIGGVITSVILFLLLANNYYHYFPTLSALSDHFDAKKIVTVAIHQDSRSHIVFEQFYQAPNHLRQKGGLYGLTIPASQNFSPRQGRIYLPPALQGNNLIKLPVVVLLGGYPGAPVDWEHGGIETIMNSFASRHKGLAPIVAVVDYGGTNDIDTECVNSKLGAVETYLAKDVPNYLKAHFQTSLDPKDWTIAGYSAGGTCSTLMALRNPNVYQNFMNISGDSYPSLSSPEESLAILFNGSQQYKDEHTPNLLLEKGNKLYSTMNGWYSIGAQDKQSQLNRLDTQTTLARKAGLNVHYSTPTGHHDFITWKKGYVDGLVWMMNQIRFTVNEK